MLHDPPTGDVVSNKSESQALTRVAEAFEKWLQANFPAPEVNVEADEIKATEAELQAKLIVFLSAVNID